MKLTLQPARLMIASFSTTLNHFRSHALCSVNEQHGEKRSKTSDPGEFHARSLRYSRE